MAQIMSISSADELRQVFSSAATTQKVNFNFKTHFRGFKGLQKVVACLGVLPLALICDLQRSTVFLDYLCMSSTY